MDTTQTANTAEDLIAHKLQRAGILVAKPKFDQNGADLLALLDVSDSAKFCRIQCKGRSLTGSPNSNVTVPREYVTDGFVLFLYVDAGAVNETNLFCFLGREIRAWRQRDASYVLDLTRSGFKSALAAYIFDERRLREVIKVIINIDVKGEFKKMIHGYAEGTLQGLAGSASGTVGTPSNVSEASDHA